MSSSNLSEYHRASWKHDPVFWAAMGGIVIPFFWIMVNFSIANDPGIVMFCRIWMAVTAPFMLIFPLGIAVVLNGLAFYFVSRIVLRRRNLLQR